MSSKKNSKKKMIGEQNDGGRHVTTTLPLTEKEQASERAKVLPAREGAGEDHGRIRNKN